ncbi:PAS domain S-box protein [Ureibacillus manganicus]|uniref:Diguanylate cyclase n=1 Tax=Ureibacillus manganicus DSM 26584 TaxID=1384049 RepID=A0A0A3IT48_9BACL|nr:PAS domain S-box protein [Ureibacillus manganicus]KGR78002.1 hypothetical protein CD29_12645 [Ureibacillus manganicus DSM 26584]
MRNFIEQFEQAFYHASIGMAILSLDGIRIKVNPALSYITGYAEGELLSVCYRDIIHPDDVEEDFHHIEALLTGERNSYEMETRYIHKNGSVAWVLHSVFIVRNDDDSLFFISQVQDITKRKKLELAVSESEERLRNLISQLPDPVVVHDGETILFANPSAAQLVDMPLKDLIGEPTMEFVAPEHLDLAERIIKEILETNQPNHDFDLRLRTKKGQLKDAILSAIPIMYLGKESIMVSYREITERKKVEQELKESEERYRQLVEFSPLGIVVHQDKIISYVNSTALRLLGAENINDVIGSHISKYIHPNYQETVFNEISALNNGEIIPTTTEKYIRHDGKVIDVEVNAMPIQLNGKSAVQVVFWDITEKKKESDLVRYRAYHDTLTDLPNRLKFQMDLEEELKKNNVFTVMFLDLHGLKPVNDTYGHQAGDVLLVKVTSRLSGVIETQGFIYRIGGDEFAVVVPGENNQTEIIDIINNIDEAMKQPIYISNSFVEISASIGVVFYPEHGDDIESLLRHADMAMYHAKKTKTLYKIYSN